MSEPSFGFPELTCYAQIGGRAGLVLAIPLVDGLHVVGPRVTCCGRKDHQLILQRDGSVADKGQCQSHSEKPLLVRQIHLLGQLQRNIQRFFMVKKDLEGQERIQGRLQDHGG